MELPPLPPSVQNGSDVRRTGSWCRGKGSRTDRPAGRAAGSASGRALGSHIRRLGKDWQSALLPAAAAQGLVHNWMDQEARQLVAQHQVWEWNPALVRHQVLCRHRELASGSRVAHQDIQNSQHILGTNTVGTASWTD